MRKQFHISLLGFTLAAASFAANTVLIDFGHVAADPTLGGTWNTLASSTASGTQAGLLFTDGSNSGMGIAWSNFQETTTNQNIWTHGNKDWVDANTTADYFWRGAGTATLTLTGLNTAHTYDIELVSARGATGNRVADITVAGQFTTLDVNSQGFNSLNDGWTDGNILRWSNLAPNVSGQIVVSLTAASNHSLFVNSMQVVAIPEPGTLLLSGIALCALVLSARSKRKC